MALTRRQVNRIDKQHELVYGWCMTQDALIKEIDEWLKKSGMIESRLGLLAGANSRAVQRIRSYGARMATCEKVLKFIRNNPPESFRKQGRARSGKSS